MIRKTVLLSSILALCGAFLAGCEKDFLDVTDPNNMTFDKFWKTEADADAAITAAYGGLQIQIWDDHWGHAEGWYLIQEMRSDLIDIDPGGLIDGAYLGAYQYRVPASCYEIRGQWAELYKAILGANEVLENVPGMNIDATKKAIVLGEAKFIRAYAHFYLLVNFGNIPLITKVPKSADEYYAPQATSAQVYQQIEADLNDAKAVLPSSWESKWLGRATKGAATAYLGKVYLFQKKWSQAVAEFKEVTTMGYALVPDIYSLYNGLNEYSSESIFEINFTEDRSGGRIEGESISPGLWTGDWLQEWPNAYMVSLFKADTTADGNYSSRVYASAVFDDSLSTMWYLGGQTYRQYFGPSENRWFWKKYCYYDAGSGLPTNYTGINSVAMRYADVLLMLAEALNEAGSTAEAVTYVNQVRDRAGSLRLSSGMTQEALRQHIRHVERPLEFTNEPLRFQDLVRWGDVQQTLVAHNRPYATNFRAGVDELFPIPSRELASNPNIRQNPGY